MSDDQGRLRELRRHAGKAPDDRIVLATLRIRIPKGVWTGPFSRTHPNTRLEALNRTEVVPDVSVSDYWIEGSPPGSWAREILEYPDVLRAESLAEVGGGCLYRITYQNPQIVSLYRRLHLPIQFPLRIQAGYILWEVVARASEFQEVLEYSRSTDPEMTIVSIRRRPLRTHLPQLTETQERLLRDAMAAGYFAVPRGITLTNLAKKLQRSKSSISESIALIEQKLLETAVRAPFAPR
ncbi:MAG: helix-turn-helix domain-containing protein [Thermoplasmata archaeon]|nr:helix-turn-helix domain-containing protein [Thermoplasmata archaeon]